MGRVSTEELPAAAWLAALAGFEGMTNRRFRMLVARRTPREAFAIASGAVPAPPAIAEMHRRDDTLAARWRRSAAQRTPESAWSECRRASIQVVATDDPLFPAQLLDDPTCPPVLFVRGRLDRLDARRVAIVGTRNATQRGRQTAARFGHDLAAAGVAIVSGLARGVDGAAHRGCLAGGGAPIGVVGNGLDAPYPREHGTLWGEVAERGVLLSEWPPGTAPDAFRFPLRNRLIAALSEVVVVVESRERGGSLSTAREAAERGIDVFAVPGALDSRASVGTNALLRDGAAPATEPADVLAALGLDTRRSGRNRHERRPPPDAVGLRVLDLARQGSAISVDRVASALALGVTDAALALAHLEANGWLIESNGWFETVDEWADLA
jgi:DNA processing protein